MDKILATEPMLLLGKWISDAKSLGVTPLVRKHFVKNFPNYLMPTIVNIIIELIYSLLFIITV